MSNQELQEGTGTYSVSCYRSPCSCSPWFFAVVCLQNCSIGRLTVNVNPSVTVSEEFDNIVSDYNWESHSD